MLTIKHFKVDNLAEGCYTGIVFNRKKHWKGAKTMRQERQMVLEKTLSGLHRYRGWMIGKCRLSFGREEKPSKASEYLQQSCHLVVLRADQRLVEVEITNPEMGDKLRVMLTGASLQTRSRTDRAAREAAGKQLDMKPEPGQAAAGSQQQAVKAESNQKATGAFLVTSEEISAYLQASEDENPIHRGEEAVVPGFLMVNRILEGYGDCIEASVRFYLPLQCKEPAKLVEQKTGEHSRTVELFTDRGRILQMKLREKDEGGEQL